MQSLLKASLFRLLVAVTIVSGTTSAFAANINTSTLGQNGWFSDDTRSDGFDGFSAGTNLVGTKTNLFTGEVDEPNSAVAGHDAAIDQHISFGNPPVAAPPLEHQGAVHLSIGNNGSGKAQISHILTAADDATTGGHAPGSILSGSGGLAIDYSWMGDGLSTVTASLKLGIRTSDHNSVPIGASGRTGEDVWDKLLIYEPGQGNGGTSNGSWISESITDTSGSWWIFNRNGNGNIAGSANTLSSLAGNAAAFPGAGGDTIADVMSKIAAGRITSIQFGIGSGNANGSVYVNQLETNFYRSGDVTTFGTFSAPPAFVPEPSSLVLLSLGLLAVTRRRRR